MTQAAFRGPPNTGANSREFATVIQAILRGKLNAVKQAVSLTANSATTTISDPRLTAQSWIGFMPTTANGAAALTNIYVSSRGSETATLTHTNNAQTDRTFDLLIIG